jgi:hypothetical protein
MNLEVGLRDPSGSIPTMTPEGVPVMITSPDPMKSNACEISVTNEGTCMHQAQTG